MAETAWLAPLAELRLTLAGRKDGRGQVGSLRWLEERVHERGGNPASVRNIIYRDVGTPADKLVLRTVLEDLAERSNVNVQWPAVRVPTSDPGAERLLDREKRRVYRRFLADVRNGRTPRMVVVAKPGAGKTLLVDHLSRALPDALLVRFEHDLAPELTRLAEVLGLPGSLIPELLARLESGAPYAVSGAVQHELSRMLVNAIRASERHAVLIRADAHAQLNGHTLRLTDGTPASPAQWIWHHLAEPLARAPLGMLLAVSNAEGLPESPSGYGEAVVLQPPSLEDMRRYVHAKLPQLPPAEVESIVRRAGRDYDSLGLLTLLAGVGQSGAFDDPLPPLPDSSLRSFLEALHVASSVDGQDVPVTLLEALIDRERRTPIAQWRDLERAFLEPATAGYVRPTNATLVARLVQHDSNGLQERLTELHRAAAQLAFDLAEPARALHHALRGQHWDLVQRTAIGALVEQAWKAITSGDVPGVPAGVLNHLACAVVEHFTELGRYAHPIMNAALERLEQADEHHFRVWAGVKRAESLIDAARFDEAQGCLARLKFDEEALDPLTRVELSLIHAAFARWEGQAATASRHVSLAASRVPGSGGAVAGKVRTWRGLIAKDLGAWDEAVDALTAVADDPNALPLQHDRAHYHLGDVWTRLGQFPRARHHLERAVEGLVAHGASAEELTNSRGRLGTVLRRLGELDASERLFTEALMVAPDDFTRARTYSEASLLHAARGHFDKALWMGNWAWRQFKLAETHRPLEAVYRRHRLEYRVALAYLCRGLGCVYLPPLHGAQRDHPDLMYARQLLRNVLKEMPGEGALRVDVHLALALSTPDADAAVSHARDGVRAAPHPYNHMQARAFLAEALLRAGKHDEALAEVNLAYVYARSAARQAGESTLNDPGYAAWLLTLEAQAITPRDAHAALRTFLFALRDDAYQAFRTGIGVTALRTLAGTEVHDEITRLILPDGPGLLQLPDAARALQF